MHKRLDPIQAEIQEFIGGDNLIEHGIVIFSFLTPDGESRTGYISFNEPDIQQTLGMMELSKAHILGKQGDLTAE